MTFFNERMTKKAVAPRLALSLSSDAVALWMRSETGWTDLGAARIEAENFNDQIESLRVEALVRDPSGEPVLIWLPPEQVLLRELALNSRNAASAGEAASSIAAETDFTAEELTIALVPGGATGKMPVMAALVQTVQEARTYVSTWGFKPGPVSTKDFPAEFGATGPMFEMPPTPMERAAGSARRMAMAAAVALAIGGAVFGAFQAVQPLLEEPVDIRSDGPRVTTFAVVLDPVFDLSKPLPPVQVGTAGNLGLQRRLLSDADRLRAFGTITHSQPRTAREVTLSPPPDNAPMSVGSAPKAPEIHRPGRLAATGKVTQPDVNTMRLALNRIRLEGQGAALDPDRTRPTFKRAQPSDEGQPADAAVLASIDPDAITADTNAVAPAAEDTLTPSEDADQQQTGGGAKPDAETEAEAEDTKALDASELAPDVMTVAPAPRPDAIVKAVAAEAKAEAEARAKAEAEALAKAKAEEKAAELARAKAEDVAQPADAVSETALSADKSEDAAAEAEQQTEAPTEFAAVTAPQPSKRPKIFERAISRPNRTASLAAVAIPRSVQSAAQQRGLELDQTSLIGILDARNGRQALVRTSDGAFRKVSRGDVIEGWRVSSISREAMRLTRRGQNRTLLLVSR